MGSNMSCNFASLYVGFLEKTKILNEAFNPFFSSLLVYKRYVDDIFCLFKGSVDLLHSFCQFLNSSSQHLKFTMHYDQHRVSFLDTWIIRQDDTLFTDLYTKATDRNSLLRADSHHPLPLKNSLPYSQFCRLKRICKNPNDFNKHVKTMTHKFRDRGYNERQLKSAIEKIDNRSRADLFTTVPKTNNSIPLFITKYSQTAESIKPILHRHWHILQTDPQLNNVFNTPPEGCIQAGQKS